MAKTKHPAGDAPAPADFTPPASAPPGGRRFSYEVHNPLVNHLRGEVTAADEAEARAAVVRWLSTGLSFTEVR